MHWFVYDAPQGKAETATTRAVIDRDGFHHDGNSDDIVRTETPVKTEKPQQHPPIQEPITAPATPMVVVSVEAICQQTPTACDPEPTPTQATDDTQQAIAGIPGKHQPTARQALRTLTKEEADSVVTALTLALSKGTVSNPIGYLLQLVKASKNGTFSPVAVAQAAPTMTLGERIAKEREKEREAAERGRMSNQQYFEWLAREYGDKAPAQKPASSTKISMLRSAVKTA